MCHLALLFTVKLKKSLETNHKIKLLSNLFDGLIIYEASSTLYKKKKGLSDLFWSFIKF